MRGKRTIRLDKKTKAENVLYVDGLKHNLLTVSQMCDNGHEAVFRYEVHDIKNSKSRMIVAKAIKSNNNLYIFMTLDTVTT